ncbi:unnamed protein product [Gongylonema pulchrum]|uniref:Uncharacterized protein n=1 Tax=Gongylonema pulchrum TaxID=637853 RepID=A0A183D8Q1_9BILA|nr:unnamed protein product [Gongylonema pulchrum]
MCHASASPRSHWRTCACSSDKCNEKGIEDLLAKYFEGEREETTTYGLENVEKDFLIIWEG